MNKKNQELRRLKARSDINEILCVVEKHEDADYKEKARKFMEDQLDGTAISDSNTNEEVVDDMSYNKSVLDNRIQMLEDYE